MRLQARNIGHRHVLAARAEARPRRVLVAHRNGGEAEAVDTVEQRIGDGAADGPEAGQRNARLAAHAGISAGIGCAMVAYLSGIGVERPSPIERVATTGNPVAPRTAGKDKDLSRSRRPCFGWHRGPEPARRPVVRRGSCYKRGGRRGRDR
ncbi:MAG: hypothetical protein AcusKO_39240 [Acuticoccus sp.]